LRIHSYSKNKKDFSVELNDIDSIFYKVVLIFYGKLKIGFLNEHTGLARNFDYGGPKMEKSCDVSLVTFFGDVMATTSLK